MREELDHSLTLEDMADIAYISPYHFNRIFRQIVGIPPSQFLYALRLQRAKRLLLTTSMSVTAICFEVGYNSLGSFVKRFTDLVGVSPTRLRRLVENESFFVDLEALLCQGAMHPPAPPAPLVTGHVRTPDVFDGPLFIGLFPKHIPQRQPVAGTLITAPGAFAVGNVPPGRHYLFVAGFPWPAHPLGYLLPDEDRLQVGVSRSPVEDGRSDAEVHLRPRALTDPPILIVLPLLVAEHLAVNGYGSRLDEKTHNLLL